MLKRHCREKPTLRKASEPGIKTPTVTCGKQQHALLPTPSFHRTKIILTWQALNDKGVFTHLIIGRPEGRAAFSYELEIKKSGDEALPSHPVQLLRNLGIKREVFITDRRHGAAHAPSVCTASSTQKLGDGEREESRLICSSGGERERMEGGGEWGGGGKKGGEREKGGKE